MAGIIGLLFLLIVCIQLAAGNTLGMTDVRNWGTVALGLGLIGTASLFLYINFGKEDDISTRMGRAVHKGMGSFLKMLKKSLEQY